MTTAIPLTDKTDLHGIVDELTYRAYRWNRIRTTHITPEEWKAAFGKDADVMEERYQREITK